MAKAKKKNVLSLEERLKQALVPKDDQPYTVPKNWCWVKGSILLHAMEAQRPQGEVFKYIDIDSIDNKNQVIKTPKDVFVKDAPSRASRKLHNGDTIFSMVRPYLKNIAYIDDMLSCCIASTGFYVCTPIKVVNKRFFFHLMISDYVVDGLNKFMKGDNSPSIRKENIEEFSYPLPPFTEQQRIVDRIESLFAKLDEAKEKAQAALDSFETRKAAILHKAFTGELTAKWREQNGVGMDSWATTKWGNIINKIEAGKNFLCEGHPPNSSEFGIVKVSAVTWGEFNQNESKTCSSKEHWNPNIKIHSGDFLFSRANTLQLVGNCVIVKDVDKYLMLSDKILRLFFNKGVQSFYVLYFTRTRQYREQVERLASGNQDGMRNISQKNMALIELPFPSIPEQIEIVRLLENFFAKEQKAKELCSVLDKIDLIKKSILARAFRGELGTNDPTEESAMELLKSIV